MPNEERELVLYFPVKVAVHRAGGTVEVSKRMGVPVATVNSWIAPTLRRKPSDDALEKLSDLSGVAVESFHRYYLAVKRYREAEKIRRS